MKSVLFMFALTVALFSVTGLVLPPKSWTINSGKTLLVETLTFGYVNRLVKELRTLNQPGEGLATLLPPIDDPLIINATTIPVNITLDIADPPVTVLGTIELTEETHITGLGTITDDLVIDLERPPYKASWDLMIPSINVNGSHILDLALDLGSSHTLVGSGSLIASVNEVFVHVLAELRVVGFVRVNALELDLGFSGLALDLGDVKLDETEVDWESQADNIQTWFDTFWTNNDEVKGLITEAVRCSADHVVNGCTLVGLIGGQDCLKVEINLECLAPLFPQPGSTTTEDPVTSTTTEEEPVTSTTTEEPEASTTTGGPSPTTGDPATTTEDPDNTTDSGFRFASNALLLPLVGLLTLFQ